MADPRGADFINAQYNNGTAVGPRIDGDVFFDPNHGIVLTDRTTGLYYRLYVDNGIMYVEEITLTPQ